MDTSTQLSDVSATLVPRLLTQACRDPNSPCHGCFDRDWWHYKIRDFPSIILQQGGYSAWLAAGLPAFSPWKAELTALAAASCRFWNQRATRRGAFEEYYPHEQGYPPLAFSTLAVAKLVAAGVAPAADVEPGARAAARQLLARFEPQAANQQVAGLAALAWLRRVFPALAPDAAFDRIAGRTLALQTAEGWFVEYGGPDLGYLSVTLDCLWDLFDATGDPRYRAAAAAGLACIARYAAVTGGGIGLHNARNTDYILPYGIARFAVGEAPERATAERLLTALYANVSEPAHFLRAMDDRYLSHYAGHSLLRAATVLAARSPLKNPAREDARPPETEDRLRSMGGRAAPRAVHQALPASGAATPPSDVLLPASGHYLRPAQPGRAYAAILSLRKGGILTAVAPSGRVSDFGWLVESKGRQFVNHWWSDAWRWTREGDSFTIRGNLAPHREHLSTPPKHAILRLASFLLGRRVIAPLKNALIFKKSLAGPAFERTVTFEPSSIVVSDRVSGLPEGASIRPAPRSSKRHVASADSFHEEDFRPVPDAMADRTQHFAKGVFEAKTVYTLG